MNPPRTIVIAALTNNANQGPIKKTLNIKSNNNTLYDENNNNADTTGLKLAFRSCLVHSQINVAVAMYCINEMLDSKHFCMYFQSNSAPLAPTHSSNALDNITSAVAQPMPAVKTLQWPLPGILLSTMYKPTKSAKSTVDLRNSCNCKY